MEIVFCLYETKRSDWIDTNLQYIEHGCVESAYTILVSVD